MGEKGPPGIRQLDLSRGALKELRLEVRLELADQGAQRLLREMQPLRGTREMQLLRNRDERSEVTKIEIGAQSLLPLSGIGADQPIPAGRAGATHLFAAGIGIRR